MRQAAALARVGGAGDGAPRTGLRIASYNVEWFNALFDDRGRILDDMKPSSRWKVTRREQIGALGIVFNALDADGIVIIEAPDTNRRRTTERALERFATSFGLRARRALIGFPSETEQEIAFLYDPDRLGARHDPKGERDPAEGPTAAPRFDRVFRFDLNNDAVPEAVTFSKPPLELQITTAGGRALRLIGVHAKSKAPHGARGASELMRLSIENRRKQLAQCIWLRRRVEAHLAAGEDLIVAGDFNDGPGLDDYEKLFGRSGIEVVLGPAGTPEAMYDPHADLALTQRIGLAPTSARFYLAPAKRYFEALLDFIMVSPGLAGRDPAPAWRIWHPFNDQTCFQTPELREALLQASDHFPVTVDFPALG
jgi:endonuclease/exonuclease/phosphatase family metal-dependent hydrolase